MTNQENAIIVASDEEVQFEQAVKMLDDRRKQLGDKTIAIVDGAVSDALAALLTAARQLSAKDSYAVFHDDLRDLAAGDDGLRRIGQIVQRFVEIREHAESLRHKGAKAFVHMPRCTGHAFVDGGDLLKAFRETNEALRGLVAGNPAT